MDGLCADINARQRIDTMRAVQDQYVLGSGHSSIFAIFISNTIHNVFEIEKRTGEEAKPGLLE